MITRGISNTGPFDACSVYKLGVSGAKEWLHVEKSSRPQDRESRQQILIKMTNYRVIHRTSRLRSSIVNGSTIICSVNRLEDLTDKSPE